MLAGFKVPRGVRARLEAESSVTQIMPCSLVRSPVATQESVGHLQGREYQSPVKIVLDEPAQMWPAASVKTGCVSVTYPRDVLFFSSSLVFSFASFV